MDQDSAMIECTLKDLRQVPHHVPALAAWHQDEWGFLNPDRGVADRIEEMKEHLGTEVVPTTFVAEDSHGNLVGSAAILTHDMSIHRDKTPWLASVYVDARHRRKGIGATVVKRIMQHAADNGVRQMYLYTMDQEALYQRLGWQTISREVYRDTNVIVMEVNPARALLRIP